MGKHRKDTPAGDYVVGYKRPPPAKKNVVNNPWGRAGKPKEVKPLDPARSMREALQAPRSARSDGGPSEIMAFEGLVKKAVRNILKPERREGERARDAVTRKHQALRLLIGSARRNGWFDTAEARQRGILGLFVEPDTPEEWIAKYGREGLQTVNPLEGIPGLQDALLHRKRVEEDDVDD